MARKTLRARRFFSLIFPFFFITSVYAEQTPESAKTVTVEAKNETSRLNTPTNISHGKRRQNSLPVKMRWRKTLVW